MSDRHALAFKAVYLVQGLREWRAAKSFGLRVSQVDNLSEVRQQSFAVRSGWVDPLNLYSGVPIQ
jgi:hypothetical protein